ncbi:hypothetical protein [Serratia fonticola]
MNTLEESLALAKAWLDSVDDKTFYTEYETIKQYSSIGPTVDNFFRDSSQGEVMSRRFYVKPVNSSTSPYTNILDYNVVISTDYSLSSSAVNDENYALAA